MSHHSIDLLPAHVRMINQAGRRVGRHVAALVCAVAFTVVLATHSRVHLDRAKQHLTTTSIEADHALATEARIEELRAILAEQDEFVRRYRQLALPIDISAVLATVVNHMPASMSIERIDLNAGLPRTVRSARSKAIATSSTPSRVLKAEISGFAINDEEIADLVATLDAMSPFRDVSLDFSRSCTVRHVAAREFRLSFSIDLGATYELHPGDESALVAGEGEFPSGE